jgi:hypothetical protein
MFMPWAWHVMDALGHAVPSTQGGQLLKRPVTSLSLGMSRLHHIQAVDQVQHTQQQIVLFTSSS